jgi:hypothetical protein
MKKIYFAILSLSIICYSCKKSDDNASTTTPTNNTTNEILLRKIVTTNIPSLIKDSIQYFYDNNNRVIKIMANYSNYSDTLNITRNSNGLVTSFISRNTNRIYSSNVTIDPTSSHYISKIGFNNLGQRDTITYIYTANKITKTLGNSPLIYNRPNRTITYDNNGNLLKDSTLNFVFKRTYDTNVPSLTLGNEIIIYGGDETGQSAAEENTGSNNVLSQSVVQYGNPGYNYTYLYTYNIENKPATVTEKNGTVTKSTSIFYYQ